MMVMEDLAQIALPMQGHEKLDCGFAKGAAAAPCCGSPTRASFGFGTASTLETFTTTSLPAIDWSDVTWDSLPSVGGAGTLDSLPDFENDAQASFESEIEDYEVDFKLWGSSALRTFGYEHSGLGLVGGLGTVTKTPEASDSSLCVLRRATRKQDGAGVTIKAISSPEGRVPKAERRALFGEFCLMRALRHEAIVGADALLETRFDSWLVLDFAAATTVQSYVEARGAFEETAAVDLFSQLLQGLAYIHGRGIAHCAIAPQSILLDDSAQVLKITDFASARLSSSGASAAKIDADDLDELEKTEAELSYELRFKAPEQLFQQSWNERVDIWAAALALHFMVESRLPFDIEHPLAVEVLRLGLLPCPPPGYGGLVYHMPRETMQTLRRCLSVPMLSRPSAAEVLRSLALGRLGQVGAA